ncbi:CoA-binding protein [Lutibacter sp. TH_r2]|uniref:CoA-binding protein n=1 Tax=Lutibacter sp. TH_r2 TaxID=3082083 RepID=UPI002953DF66|nr:CoA-binding protein [Lutibacter sp. TH_r2]MDV7187165.1 CoA-binding protein [Lutibacter sp. TH_r2]
MNKKTLVIGASENPNRYSNIAIKRLREKGIDVVAFAKRNGKVEDVTIETELLNFKNVDTVTLYLSARNQPEYYQYIIDLKPKRVLFNPGTENPFFEQMLQGSNIAFERACTLVLLSIGAY